MSPAWQSAEPKLEHACQSLSVKPRTRLRTSANLESYLHLLWRSLLPASTVLVLVLPHQTRQHRMDKGRGVSHCGSSAAGMGAVSWSGSATAGTRQVTAVYYKDWCKLITGTTGLITMTEDASVVRAVGAHGLYFQLLFSHPPWDILFKSTEPTISQ